MSITTEETIRLIGERVDSVVKEFIAPQVIERSVNLGEDRIREIVREETEEVIRGEVRATLMKLLGAV